MAGAALDYVDLRLGQQAQHLGRLLADILGPGMAGDVQCDAAAERPQPRRQPLLAGDIDDILADVEGRPRQLLDGLVVGHDQRPLEFEHQRAGRHQRDDVVALVDPRAEHRRDMSRAGRHLGEIAGLELRHLAALRVDHLGRDAVAGEHRAGRLADIRVVVVDEAGGVDDRLAPGGRSGLVNRRRRAAGAVDKGAAVIFG